MHHVSDLECYPGTPNILNSAVPEMNFHRGQAVAKGGDDRYQNAKDFSADLRACATRYLARIS